MKMKELFFMKVLNLQHQEKMYLLALVDSQIGLHICIIAEFISEMK